MRIETNCFALFILPQQLCTVSQDSLTQSRSIFLRENMACMDGTDNTLQRTIFLCWVIQRLFIQSARLLHTMSQNLKQVIINTISKQSYAISSILACSEATMAHWSRHCKLIMDIGTSTRSPHTFMTQSNTSSINIFSDALSSSLFLSLFSPF